MTLQEYTSFLCELLLEHPELKDALMIYASDSEGNSYHEVGFPPSLWWATKEHDIEVYSDEDFKEDGPDESEDLQRVICVN